MLDSVVRPGVITYRTRCSYCRRESLTIQLDLSGDIPAEVWSECDFCGDCQGWYVRPHTTYTLEAMRNEE